MSDLVPVKTVPLGFTKDGRALPMPPSFSHWRVELETAGRPRRMRDGDGDFLELDGDADTEDLRDAVGDEPGWYRLIALTAEGKRLPLVACIQIEPDYLGDAGGGRPGGAGMVSADAALEHAYGLLRQMVATQEAQAMIAQQSIQTLTGAIVDMQRNAGELLKASCQTTRVATGIEALERQEAPQVDVEELATKLDATIREAGKKQSPPSWMPLVTMAMQGAQGFAQAFMAKQAAAKAQAQPAPQPEPQPEPRRQPEPRPVRQPQPSPVPSPQPTPSPVQSAAPRPQAEESAAEAAATEEPAAEELHTDTAASESRDPAEESTPETGPGIPPGETDPDQPPDPPPGDDADSAPSAHQSPD